MNIAQTGGQEPSNDFEESFLSVSMAMLLNELFPFIFRNAKGELEFVKLVDARWDKKYTLEQKIDLELMATVDLVFDMIPKRYYLTHKGSEKAMCSFYDKLKNLEQINASSSKASLSSNISGIQSEESANKIPESRGSENERRENSANNADRFRNYKRKSEGLVKLESMIKRGTEKQ